MTDASPQAARQAVAHWVREHGECLLRYTLSRVPDPHIAEDLVQETYLAAIRSFDRFSGRSSPRTWLIAILRRKMADYYRQRMRHAADPSDDTPAERAPFDAHGNWRHELKAWPKSAESELQDQEFWQVFEDCLSALPANLMSAFAMRVMDELQPRQVCEILKISVGNLSVRLHRARLALRDCLEQHWFGEGHSKSKGQPR